jgi:hypothetical protein
MSAAGALRLETERGRETTGPVTHRQQEFGQLSLAQILTTAVLHEILVKVGERLGLRLSEGIV